MDANKWDVKESPQCPPITQNVDTDDEVQCTDSRYGQNVKNYETEWRDLCIMVASEPNLVKLRTIAISGDLKVSKFRSVFWSVLLGGLGTDPSKWIEERHEQRLAYQAIKQKHTLDPTTIKVAQEEDNPLSQAKTSTWNQHFNNVELKNLIQQDVARTNPNVDFYHKKDIQEIMISILFCYARQYPKLCYRQGMHEVLAPFIFVLHCDHQSLGHIQEETNVQLEPTLVEVLNPSFIEADSYLLFSQIMDNLELYYRVHDMKISENGQLTYIPLNSPDSPESPKDGKRKKELEVVNQLDMVRDKVLAKHDLHLHNHLLKLEIPLGLFGIRWLRLLFGREFNLLDLLMLWDAIFGIGDDLKFVNFIVVAMLIHIRDKLLNSDYTQCLTFLMRFPGNSDISLIIRHALYMCEPEKYQCPPNAFVYIVSSMRQHRLQQTPGTAKKQPIVSLVTSPRRLRDEIQRETVKMATSSRKEDGVVDGYQLDDPQVLKMELFDAYNIMDVSRIKLVQYVSILRKYIPGHRNDELHQTLDGLEELCTLLKPKHQFLFTTNCPVDAAYEVAVEEGIAEPVSRRNVRQTMGQEAMEVPVVRPADPKATNGTNEVEMNVIRASVLGSVDQSRYPQPNPVHDGDSSD